MLGVDGKEKPVYYEGQKVEFNLNGTIKGYGIIRGQSVSGLLDMWIVEVADNVGIDPAVYPWSCIVVPHTLMKAVREVPTQEAIADEIASIAMDWEEDHQGRWGEGVPPQDQDPKMVEVGKSDAADLRNIAHLVRRGELQPARNLAAKLDTIVREELPSSFFELLKVSGVHW